LTPLALASRRLSPIAASKKTISYFGVVEVLVGWPAAVTNALHWAR
jgi:hypothetical protein